MTATAPRRRFLRVAARTVWVALAIPTIGILILAARMGLSAEDTLMDMGWSTAAYRAAMAGLGLSPTGLDLIFVSVNNLNRLTFVGMSLLLIWRRPDDRMAYFTSLTLLTISITLAGAPGLSTAQPALTGVITFLQAVGQAMFLTFVLIFPDGRFVPAWLRWPSLAAILVTILQRLPGLGAYLPISIIALAATLWLIGSTVPAQVYRYLRVSSALQRQQTKLVVVGIAAFFIVSAGGGWLLLYLFLPSVLPSLVPEPETRGRLLYDLIVNLTQVIPPAFLPLSVSVAVLRYRLWDLDLIIRRTLLYGVLTGLLAGVYFGSVVIFENLLRGLTGGQSPLVIVLSTLLIAALFVPLRSRVQRFIDRRFYRRKYDAAKTLATFATAARDEVDLDRLSTQLVGAVDNAIQPEQVSLWLRAKRS